VLDALVQSGRMRDTLIVFTSDHGDFLGDRGLGEKELFHDEIQRVPMLLYDPDPAADASRGSAESRFVEAVDIVPTILDALDLDAQAHRVEGRSLLPLARGTPTVGWRDCAISELDYAFRRARLVLGRSVQECRATMVRTTDWKYVHWQGFRPQLFDLAADPFELRDLGGDPSFDRVRGEMRERLLAWHTGLKRRTTIADERVGQRTDGHRGHGVHIGIW
jgi:arylsulfatase A-like enzyme